MDEKPSGKQRKFHNILFIDILQIPKHTSQHISSLDKHANSKMTVDEATPVAWCVVRPQRIFLVVREITFTANQYTATILGQFVGH
jgi:hypothetical protein